ncbi:MAG: PrsW family glutamic-type intramembrane protease [Lachnospiraceae bacterium]
MIRGISAGAIHILCGITTGFGISYVFGKQWLAVTGAVGILGACIGFHGIYNLLVTASGGWNRRAIRFRPF